MELEHETSTRLTAPELSGLWTQYMNDTMSVCFVKYALATIEDSEIKSIFETAMKLSQHHIQKIKEFFQKENYPLPQGFTDQDVNPHAPRLFTDPFFLNYMYIMTMHGLTGYAISLEVSSRIDIREYFTKCNMETMDLYNNVINVMLSKGLFTRPPYINPPEISLTAEKDFLTGWFGKRRPLTALEISNITFNMNKTYLSKALSMAFAQVANSEEVRKYLTRGLEISTKHTETFSKLFIESHLNFPISWESLVTNSTTAPFSDKLIMFHMNFLSAAAVAFYGAAQAACLRRDISLQYVRLIAEQLLFSEDGVQIMLKNGWMEKPPIADDRMDLMKGKKK